MATDPAPDDDAWIEKLVAVAGALGFNRMRVRWKLLRWQESRRKSRRWREQRIAHIRYEHKTCPECGAVQDRAEAVCTRCGAKLTSRTLQVLQRIGLTPPEFLSMSTLLVLALIGVHLRIWLAAGSAAFGLPIQLLIDFGGRYPPLLADEPWRLLTAIFLHAGLLHLAFNALALASIGPRIEELYGRLTLLLLFVVTGTLASAASAAVGVQGVGIGASGGIMGLVGAAAGHGQRVGTSHGKALRNSMLQWAAYTVIFGFWIHADNAAHLFGFVAGAVFGYLVRPSAWKHPRLLVLRAIAKLAGGAAAIAALAIIFTRHPVPLRGAYTAEAPDDDFDDEHRAGLTVASQVWRDYAPVCRQYFGGDPAGAVAAAQDLRVHLSPTESVDSVGAMCESLAQLRDACCDTSGSSASLPVPPGVRPRCNELVRLFEGIPDGPARRAAARGGSGAPAGGPAAPASGPATSTGAPAAPARGSAAP